MKIVERRVSGGNRELFDLEEFLSRPLFAHLATTCENGPRESPVWFLWEDGSIWIIGGKTFPLNIQRDARCAIGIVDFDRATGLVHHVGFRGSAVVRAFDKEIGKKIFRRYVGPDENEWDPLFDDVRTGNPDLVLVRFQPETVVIRDQSYKVAGKYFDERTDSGRTAAVQL
jgi:hypothetical protein